jgi:hypothetical protein
MSDTWQDRAQRGLTLLDANNSAHATTIGILNKVLDTNNSDLYISSDFFNVQQTAGGLPDTLTFDDFVARIAGHIRGELGGSSLALGIGDDDVRAALLTWNDNIMHHFTFLNGVVHQAAAGDVHVKLWNYILDAVKNDQSIYACYRDIIIDDR